jgi:hypothetical protein
LRQPPGLWVRQHLSQLVEYVRKHRELVSCEYVESDEFSRFDVVSVTVILVQIMAVVVAKHVVLACDAGIVPTREAANPKAAAARTASVEVLCDLYDDVLLAVDLSVDHHKEIASELIELEDDRVEAIVVNEGVGL